MAKRFAVYKGLQKPLIFKGFKGKFIYWGVGSLLLGLVTGSVTMALINMYAGVLVLIGIIAGGSSTPSTNRKVACMTRPVQPAFTSTRPPLKKSNLYEKKRL